VQDAQPGSRIDIDAVSAMKPLAPEQHAASTAAVLGPPRPFRVHPNGTLAALRPPCMAPTQVPLSLYIAVSSGRLACCYLAG